MFAILAIVLGVFVVSRQCQRKPIDIPDEETESDYDESDYDSDQSPVFSRIENKQLIQHNIMEYKNDPYSFDEFWGSIYETYETPTIQNNTRYHKYI